MAIQSGIYMILNLLNGKRYVGSAVNLRKRRQDHFRALRKEKSEHSHLQNAFNKYGRDAFGWEVLEYIEDLETLILWENIYLGMYWPTGLLYNSCPVAGSMLGYERTEESKRKNSKAQTGKCFSAETKQKMRKAGLKRWANREFRRMMREANSALWAAGEQNPNYGKKCSAESKRRHSKAALKRWKDAEYRQHMLNVNPMFKGLKGTQNPMFGKHHSDAAKQKMRNARKRWWVCKRQAEHLLMLVRLVVALRKRLASLAAIV